MVVSAVARIFSGGRQRGRGYAWCIVLSLRDDPFVWVPTQWAGKLCRIGAKGNEAVNGPMI